MDLWPKQTGNVAGSELHGKLAAHSEAVCLNDGAICFFWRRSPAPMLLWLYDQMTLFTGSGNSNWHTLQLLSPNQWSQMECSCCKGFSGTFWSHESAGAVAAADASVSVEQLKNTDIIQASAGMGINSLCQLSKWTTLHPVWQSWSCLFNWCHWFWLWRE